MRFGHNFWVWGPIDPRSTRLNCILQDLFRDQSTHYDNPNCSKDLSRWMQNSHCLLGLVSSWEYWPGTNFKISISANISISTQLKIQDIDHTWFQNLDQDSTSLPLQNISSKILTKLQLQILPELQLQNLDQTLCSKSEQKFSFLTKPQLPNLPQTVANTILVTNISNSNNINKFWVTRHGHINQSYLTGVSQSVTITLPLTYFLTLSQTKYCKPLNIIWI